MEQNHHPDFNSIFSSFCWRPIYGCPGRFILKEKRPYTIHELAGNEIDIKIYTDKSRDTVYVAMLQGGGIISYQKADGVFIHTLGNSEGFARKLKMLGIERGH